MKKPFYISFILLIAALVFFNFYKYREQSLGELVDINRVEELYIVVGD